MKQIILKSRLFLDNISQNKTKFIKIYWVKKLM